MLAIANNVYTLRFFWKGKVKKKMQQKTSIKLALPMTQATTAISSLPFTKMSTVLFVACLFVCFNSDFLVLQRILQNPS